MKELTHGKYATYSNHGCRCEACKEAHNAWHRKYRASETGKQRATLANRRSRRVQQEAAKLLKREYPDHYATILAEVAKELGD